MFLQRWIDGLTFERFAAVLFFIVIGTVACLMPAQNDTWWQLKAGEEIIAMRTGLLAHHRLNKTNGRPVVPAEVVGICHKILGGKASPRELMTLGS